MTSIIFLFLSSVAMFFYIYTAATFGGEPMQLPEYFGAIVATVLLVALVVYRISPGGQRFFNWFHWRIYFMGRQTHDLLVLTRTARENEPGSFHTDEEWFAHWEQYEQEADELRMAHKVLKINMWREYLQAGKRLSVCPSCKGRERASRLCTMCDTLGYVPSGTSHGG
jgi:hypothetical protein